jgi:hypothetical protein
MAMRQSDPRDALNGVEGAVFTYAVNGYRPDDIAKRLGISSEAVADCIANIMVKLGYKPGESDADDSGVRSPVPVLPKRWPPMAGKQPLQDL